ncbi:hypothetical protein PSN45_002945 [Yamadazyma tenuis]|uniref:Uncharacterized protein n=1 Tax=Candida tenuis (strain ATCC 10573 / BCRC 21748 / CBS 615 / JCM 9827 / NBRC 10315 / NRRL Y-1498 / VKM Y-70) TaxID=590646 RepID=G3AW52_CANTC|nr:uncharacterized protein CANTEDRAFT_112184 [Yamadazyma tenuis ATCC 10573]EGV66453.1 hypothetical protein CANTEDRAFT_112184 [Yamadazyma tenuis ATCC 10573]WEJ95426.1 hypothetical protein PSN45_002945 [Yamadazyma tenuis]
MLWWNSTKETQEIEKELPEDLKEFFQKNNPDDRQYNKYKLTPQQIMVNAKLKKISQEYSYDLETYKRKNSIRNVSITNCAELQLKVVDCFKSLNFTSIDNCSKQIKANKNCVEIQSKAFNKMFYNDCYSTQHCDKIRFLVDHLFTSNFGQYGENMNEETLAKFDKDLDANFSKVWK